jgi:UDP-glucuronate decarboxylase
VSDLVDGLCRLLDATATGPINLGNPTELTMAELAERVRAATATSSPIVHRDLPADDPTRRRPDVTLAKSVLGWEPSVSFDEGLERTIEHFRSLVG